LRVCFHSLLFAFLFSYSGLCHLPSAPWIHSLPPISLFLCLRCLLLYVPIFCHCLKYCQCLHSYDCVTIV
jgi:hypothetical protein